MHRLHRDNVDYHQTVPWAIVHRPLRNNVDYHQVVPWVIMHRLHRDNVDYHQVVPWVTDLPGWWNLSLYNTASSRIVCTCRMVVVWSEGSPQQGEQRKTLVLNKKERHPFNTLWPTWRSTVLLIHIKIQIFKVSPTLWLWNMEGNQNQNTQATDIYQQCLRNINIG